VEQIGDEQELGKVAEQTGDEQEQEKVAEQIGDEQELVKVAEQTGDEQEPEKVVEQTGDERGLEKAAAQTGDGRELERAAEQTGDLHLVVTSAHVANTPMSSLIAHTHIHTPVVPLRVVTSTSLMLCSHPVPTCSRSPFRSLRFRYRYARKHLSILLAWNSSTSS